MKHVEKSLAPIDNSDKRALRDGFGDGLLELGKTDKNVVALCADLTESCKMDAFRDAYPERFVEIGVAEQNLIGVACGMAHTGKIPFAGSFAVFSPGRSWDQIRVSGCYSNANLKIYGGHAGITVGEDGATHQALEDIAITRVIPRMTVLVPCDATEMKKATLAAASTPGTIYLRGGRPKLPQVTTESTPFTIGEANLLREGKDVTIIACGILVREALLAARELEKMHISARVINVHTIKPIDEDAVLAAAHDTGAIVTAEEHQIIGGLGSAVAEVLCTHLPVPIERVGIKDTFGESGTVDALLDKYGLRAHDIIRAVQHVLVRKKRKGLRTFKPSSADVRKAVKKVAKKAPGTKPVRKKTVKKKKKR